jgi:hypothetical protein
VGPRGAAPGARAAARARARRARRAFEDAAEYLVDFCVTVRFAGACAAEAAGTARQNMMAAGIIAAMTARRPLAGLIPIIRMGPHLGETT